ncbi:MAG: glutathione S-transferase family protein [Gammaproteobacteria bacterium]
MKGKIMKLYGALASPYVARVVMVARLKGLELEMESAPGGMGSDEYKQINPTGKIPSLLTDEGLIAESEVIIEYLEDKYPEPALLPREPLLRAHSRSTSRITDLYVAPWNTGLRQQRDPANRDQAFVDNAAAEFAKAFSLLAHFMGPGPFAAGDQPSLGDCAAAPFIILLKQTVFPYFDEIPDPTDHNERLRIWWQAMQEHEGCHAAVEECDVALREFLVFLDERLRQRGIVS